MALGRISSGLIKHVRPRLSFFHHLASCFTSLC
jgi:hypothetical protein